MINATSRRLYPWERDPVPLVQEAGWAPRPVWTDAGNFAPAGIFFYCLELCISSVLFFVCIVRHSAFFLSLLTTHNTNIHAPGRIRSRNPCRRAATKLRPRSHSHLDPIRTLNTSKRSAANPRLRPPCHWDRQRFDPRTIHSIASRFTD